MTLFSYVCQIVTRKHEEKCFETELVIPIREGSLAYGCVIVSGRTSSSNSFPLR